MTAILIIKYLYIFFLGCLKSCNLHLFYICTGVKSKVKWFQDMIRKCMHYDWNYSNVVDLNNEKKIQEFLKT
jgi:hypothetical protein